ncbi:SDR family oxidoreductase [Lachnospiraceae bacterium 42-17]|jgi:NAD(P)-dependent dehydrogenase (short-subunit alcohol dehydrogenase family)
MKPLVNLSERKIIVTGASSGIGKAVAIMLSELDAQVILIGRSEQRLKAVLEQMEGKPHQYYVYDLTRLDGIGSLVKRIVDEDGKKLDGLVHCAGISLCLPVRNLNYENMDIVMKTNYYSFMELIKHYSCRNHNGGSIVGVSSMAAVKGSIGQTIYAASKAAVDISVKTLSKELVKKNIRINSVRPGFINTAMVDQWNEKTKNNILGQNQLLGIGEPTDVAGLIAYLLSDASSFITGANYTIDGGSC